MELNIFVHMIHVIIISSSAVMTPLVAIPVTTEEIKSCTIAADIVANIAP